MPGKYVYAFGGGSAEGDGTQKDLLGGKGAGLAEMSRLGVPVPPGFTITTEVCAWFQEHGGSYPEGLEREVDQHLAQLEERTGQRFGDPNDPLLVSVRSGAARSMPGMMETILNLGLNNLTVQGLAQQSGNARFAFDSFRRFIQMYADVVLHVPFAQFEQLLKAKRLTSNVETDAELQEGALRSIVDEYRTLVRNATGSEFPS